MFFYIIEGYNLNNGISDQPDCTDRFISFQDLIWAIDSKFWTINYHTRTIILNMREQVKFLMKLILKKKMNQINHSIDKMRNSFKAINKLDSK